MLHRGFSIVWLHPYTHTPKTPIQEPAMPDTKRVYLFHEGNAQMRDLLGGKGANLAEMTNIGLPVPPGFTITTEVCNEYYANGGRLPDGPMEEVDRALAEVERKMDK